MLWKRNNILDKEVYRANLTEIVYTVGNHIRILRNISKKTLAEVSKDLGISPQTLSSYERLENYRVLNC